MNRHARQAARDSVQERLRSPQKRKTVELIDEATSLVNERNHAGTVRVLGQALLEATRRSDGTLDIESYRAVQDLVTAAEFLG